MAQSTVIIALASSTTLVAVVISGNELGGVIVVTEIVGGILQIKTFDLGVAPIATIEVLDSEEVLVTLHALSSEGHIDLEALMKPILSERRIVSSGATTVHSQVINDTVRKTLKSSLNSIRHSQRIGGIKHDRPGSESLVQLRLKSQGESSTIEASVGGIQMGCRARESELLSLVQSVTSEVVTVIHHIRAIWAHALGAINIAILRIADTTTGLSGVPSVDRKILETLGELTMSPIRFN